MSFSSIPLLSICTRPHQVPAIDIVYILHQIKKKVQSLQMYSQGMNFNNSFFLKDLICSKGSICSYWFRSQAWVKIGINFNVNSKTSLPIH